MELLPDGKMVLDEQDTVGVLALIYAKTRMVVDIHATTDSSLSTCHADPPRTRARAYAESNPLSAKMRFQSFSMVITVQSLVHQRLGENVLASASAVIRTGSSSCRPAYCTN